MPSNDSSTLVTCVGGHGNSRGDGRGDGVPDGRRGDGCDLPRKYSYCGMNDQTEDYCWDKWGKARMHIKCMMKIYNSPLLHPDIMFSVLLRLLPLIPPLHLNRSSRSWMLLLIPPLNLLQSWHIKVI